jgi:hypothetical protein
VLGILLLTAAFVFITPYSFRLDGVPRRNGPIGYEMRPPSPSPGKQMEPLLLGAGYYAIMLLGIVMGSVYTALDKADEGAQMSFRAILRYGFTPSTWQGMLISPIIFSILVSAGITSSVRWATVLFAFQNGFFWRATMQRVTAARAKTVADVQAV